MTKLNPQTMKNQYDHQYDTFCRKNHDYGNSFEESLDQFGIVASIVRMSDKMKRLESLTDESKTQQVGSESLLDTLEDLSNYAAMTACWLRGIREEDGDKDTVYAEDIPPRPMEIPEAVKQLWEAQKQQVDYLFAANNDKEDEKVESFNADFLNMAKTCLIPEVSIPQEEPKNIYEELEELFVKQNEHIKVLLTSGAGKTDIKPLAILDYKNKTSEAVNGYDLLVALDCLDFTQVFVL